jgi:GTP cyclohydrolase I
MGDIETLVSVPCPFEPTAYQRVPAKADAYVSLDDPSSKAIHMSRLYMGLQKGLRDAPLLPSTLESILDGFLQSHQGSSESAHLTLRFELPVMRFALESSNEGLRGYECAVDASKGPDGLRLDLSVRVVYSSTCPCSAALSRRHIQERFVQDMDSGAVELNAEAIVEWLGLETSIAATPHAQRSHGDVKVRLKEGAIDLPVLALIDCIEESLQTPVQAAVKRADEQAFAKLNAANLMYCEDAARRMKVALDEIGLFDDYRIQASHLESLHPHDAVSIVVKGVPDGFRP